MVLLALLALLAANVRGRTKRAVGAGVMFVGYRMGNVVGSYIVSVVAFMCSFVPLFLSFFLSSFLFLPFICLSLVANVCLGPMSHLGITN
jgi:hypothetical protein